MNEEDEGIDRLRRRFPNTMPTFLKGGNWSYLLATDRPWWPEEDFIGETWGTGFRRLWRTK